MKKELSEQDFNKLFRALELGLTTDGAHHKQWALVEIADALGIEMEDELREEGIAP